MTHWISLLCPSCRNPLSLSFSCDFLNIVDLHVNFKSKYLCESSVTVVAFKWQPFLNIFFLRNSSLCQMCYGQPSCVLANHFCFQILCCSHCTLAMSSMTRVTFLWSWFWPHSLDCVNEGDELATACAQVRVYWSIGTYTFLNKYSNLHVS